MFRALLLLCFPMLVAADMPRQQQALMLSLLGEWHGTMDYPDHKGKSHQRPSLLKFTAQPDMRSLLVERYFSDANKADSLLINTLGQPAKMTYRHNNKEQTFFSRTSNMQVLSDNSWILVQEHEGTEEERPATIRFTLHRNGNELNSTKEIDFSDDKYTLWQVRYKSHYKQINP